ncbi:MAG: DUF1501 domain-containing protein [Planctomycetes bacterium]|nr:DUF1501 domain-containing protein [Planctomycetota bacterium]
MPDPTSRRRGLSRRTFLERGALAASALSFPVPLRTRATRLQNGPPNILVVIFLRGGQDALNTIIPYRDKNYHAIRPTIAIGAEPVPDEELKGVVRLDANWGLHPALAPLFPLWEAKSLAPIVCCGSPHPTRSHFDAQDFMEYGAPGMPLKDGGWLNRYLRLTTGRRGKDDDLRAIAMQGLLPRSLRGDYPVLAVPERGARRAGEYLDLFDDLYGEDAARAAAPGDKQKGDKNGASKRGKMSGDTMQGDASKRLEEDPVVASGRATIETLRRYQEIVGRKTRQSRANSRFPGGHLGPRLEDIAKVINAGAGLEVACVDWNGWDHHAGQGGEDGRHATMLGELAQSIAAFFTEIGEHGKRTILCTMTEFGRTCRENGNSGTDHGHGGSMLLAGGRLSGGKVYGKFPGLDDKDLYQGRDLQVTTDYREVMAELLVRHLECGKLPADFFPEFRPSKAGVGLFA